MRRRSQQAWGGYDCTSLHWSSTPPAEQVCLGLGVSAVPGEKPPGPPAPSGLRRQPLSDCPGVASGYEGVCAPTRCGPVSGGPGHSWLGVSALRSLQLHVCSLHPTSWPQPCHCTWAVGRAPPSCRNVPTGTPVSGGQTKGRRSPVRTRALACSTQCWVTAASSCPARCPWHLLGPCEMQTARRSGPSEVPSCWFRLTGAHFAQDPVPRCLWSPQAGERGQALWHHGSLQLNLAVAPKHGNMLPAWVESWFPFQDSSCPPSQAPAASRCCLYSPFHGAPCSSGAQSTKEPRASRRPPGFMVGPGQFQVARTGPFQDISNCLGGAALGVEEIAGKGKPPIRQPDSTR